MGRILVRNEVGGAYSGPGSSGNTYSGPGSSGNTYAPVPVPGGPSSGGGASSTGRELADLLKGMFEKQAGGGGGGGGGGGDGDGLGKIRTKFPDELDFAGRGFKDLLNKGTERAIGKAGSAAREFEARGRQAVTEGSARRGLTGTGAEGLGFGQAADAANRMFTGQAADIELGENERQRALLGDIAGIGGTKGGLTAADRNSAVQAYTARMNAANASAANDLAAQSAQWQLMMQALQLAGGAW
jgi:hypothetical protein